MCDTLGAVQDQERFDESYRLLREDCGLIDLSGLQAVEFTGEDRKGWLQGQVTNDLRKLEPGGSLNFCVCQPTGRLDAICTVWALPDRFIVLTDESGSQALLDRVGKLVILEDVQAKAIDATLLSVQGPEATRSLGKLATLPALDAGQAELDASSLVFLRSNRSGYGGWDIVLSVGAGKAEKKLRKAFEPLAPEAFDAACLEAGIPIFGVDTDERTMPPELGSAFMNAYVSFNKGCYTGQEVLMRIHSRGHTNRTWVGLIGDQPMRPGDRVSHPNRDDAGTVTRAAFSPDFGPIAGGIIRNEVAFPGEIVRIVRDDVAFEAEVQEMPLLRMG